MDAYDLGQPASVLRKPEGRNILLSDFRSLSEALVFAMEGVARDEHGTTRIALPQSGTWL